MYVSNISFQVAPEIEPIWLEWMKATFIPLFDATQCFVDTKFYQIEVTEDQFPTFTLQLFAINKEKMDEYLMGYAQNLLNELQATWGEKCYHFNTNMRIVN